MTKEETAEKFCRFELCTHRNGEGTCCLYNQDNCIFHKLEKENAELKAQNDKMKCCGNCDNWNWKHNKCEKKLRGDCFKQIKWVMRNF